MLLWLSFISMNLFGWLFYQWKMTCKTAKKQSVNGDSQVKSQWMLLFHTWQKFKLGLCQNSFYQLINQLFANNSFKMHQWNYKW